MTYLELQRHFFEHLYKRYQEDNTFTFSVRRAFTANAKQNYFIGTEKSNYFAFTLWSLPCYYRGASIDAAVFIINRIEKDHFRLGFQFNTKREPVDNQNEATLALGPLIYQKAKASGMEVHTNEPSNKMFWLGIYKEKVPLNEFGSTLDKFIAEVRAIVDPAVDKIKSEYKDWSGSFINQTDFNTSIQKLYSKLGKPYPPVFESPKISRDPEEPKEKVNYWWLNCNPGIWKIENHQVGDEQTYTSHNESGNKRNIYENFKLVKPGDLVIAYEATPTKKVKAVLEITHSLHYDDDEGEVISFKIKEFVPSQVSWEQLKKTDSLEGCRVLKNNQGSLFSLEEADYLIIYDLCKAVEDDSESYTIDDADKDLFLEREEIERMMLSLKRKKNIILQGAPGVGKTYLAKRLAFLQIGKKDDNRVEMVQFHQSYAYEDFIRGFRPNDKGKFTLANGIFFDFCNKALRDPDNGYFFVIDEINRGNLSKIFGELLMLIENDKRGPEYAVPLTYRREGESKFYVPENVHIIGTMNTADRSLAIVDYALRRRFAFFDVEPKYKEKFRKYLEDASISTDMAVKIAMKLHELNNRIRQDKDLGAGFMVGHSYFCQVPQDVTTAADWYTEIVDQEIRPLLNEYWYDNESKVTDAINELYLI
ncbi:AAA family ATPase [Pontibacter sp. BT731]|uniref:AAA family ATPase n=1 Tax=Pontibacter coccineus TaxID=3063328 RepID=UPI0026E1E9FD|nr:AAA family ATPase [Pontibacter sp. BT731]MDO6392083.1 AAA family ATPase [Pontibacter sp. BT731]